MNKLSPIGKMIIKILIGWVGVVAGSIFQIGEVCLIIFYIYVFFLCFQTMKGVFGGKRIITALGICLTISVIWIVIVIRSGCFVSHVYLKKSGFVASQFGEFGAIQSALAIYYLEYGKYPSDLNILYPHYINKKSFKDIWGNDYVYIYPGIHQKNGYDLFSKGENGITTNNPQGEDIDDIVNWDKSRLENIYNYYFAKYNKNYVYVPPFPFVKLKKCGTWDIIGSIDWEKEGIMVKP